MTSRRHAMAAPGRVSVFLLACLLGACSSAPGPEQASSTGPLASTLTDGLEPAGPSLMAVEAFVDRGGRVVIRYLDGERSQLAHAPVPPVHDPAQGMPASGHAEPERVLALSSGPAPTAVTEAEVAIRPVADWEQLVAHLVGEAAALAPGDGVVLDVLQQSEWFLYRDPDGLLQLTPLAQKPPAAEPALVLSLIDLLNDAQERILGDMPGTDYLLFDTGDADYPFALMLLTEGRTLFLARPGRVSGPTGGARVPVHTARAAYHALTSQVRGLATQPVTTVGRFISGLGTTALDTLPRLQRWDGAAEPPPLAPGVAPMDLAAWEAELDTLVPGSATAGRIAYLVDGEAFFPALVHQIGAAREAIRIRLYIFDNDDYAVAIADQLKARSAELPVRILLDGLGTITGGMAQPQGGRDPAVGQPVSIANYLRRDADVQVRMLPNPWMQGDHTKVLVFDDRVAFLGGMNIGREYRYEWHDLMVGLDGPVVDRLSRDFDQAWRRAGLLGELRRDPGAGGASQRAGGPDHRPLRLLYTRPGDSQILRTQVAALRRAQQRIWVENAYLTSDRILDELIAARRRGVDVRVILPYRTDMGFIGRSNVLAANLMLRHGIRVFIYPGMSHVKAALYDGWACLGSANFDRLSLRLNRETNLATSDPDAVAGLVSQVFEPDFARAVELREPLPASWLDHLKELIADQL